MIQRSRIKRRALRNQKNAEYSKYGAIRASRVMKQTRNKRTFNKAFNQIRKHRSKYGGY